MLLFISSSLIIIILLALPHRSISGPVARPSGEWSRTDAADLAAPVDQSPRPF